jgi:hypothetical protein
VARVGAEALGDEVENSRHLLACDVELLDDLVDAQVLAVLNDRGNGQTQTCALEHPRASLLMSHDDRTIRNVALIGRVSDRQGEEEPRALACPADQCQIATVGLRERFRERQA